MANGGFITFTNLDSSINETLERGERKSRKAHASDKQKREREKIARRNRVIYDVPIIIEGTIAAIAEHEETTASQLVRFALEWFINGYLDGSIDLSQYYQDIINPRYKKVLRSIIDSSNLPLITPLEQFDKKQNITRLGDTPRILGGKKGKNMGTPPGDTP